MARSSKFVVNLAQHWHWLFNLLGMRAEDHGARCGPGRSRREIKTGTQPMFDFYKADDDTDVQL